MGTPLGTALEKVGISLGQLLNNLGLARDATLKLAGLLVFAATPSGIAPHSLSRRSPLSATILLETSTGTARISKDAC